MSFSAEVPNSYEGTIVNDGFWPDLSLTTFMTKYRVDTRLDEAVIRDLVIDAVVVVNDDLAKWKAKQLADECEPVIITLADVEPEKQVDGRHLYAVLYDQAIYNRAKGEYLREFTDYSTTGASGQRGKGDDRVSEKEEHANRYYAASLKAIRRIKGRDRVRVALIKGNIQGSPGHFF